MHTSGKHEIVNEAKENLHSKPVPVILVADKNPVNLQVLKNMLVKFQYKLITVENGKQALQSTENIQPDIVIIDENIPVADSLKICNQFNCPDNPKWTPLLFLTGLDGLQSTVSAFEPGSIDFVIKPFDGKELIARVKHHLAIKHKVEHLQGELSKKNKLITIISHDLKGSLGIIQNFIEILKRNIDMLSDEIKMELLSDMDTAAQNTLDLLSDLMEWAQAQSGGIKYRPEEIELRQMVEDVVKYYSIMAGSKDIKLGLQVGEFIVKADKNMLHLVLRNLLSNAIKFTPQGGRVEVRSTIVNDSVKIQVIDSGIGMDSHKMNQLFHIERKLSTPGTEKEQGSGMGLILCREFLQYHQTELEIKSIPGAGTTVEFLLPLAKKKRADVKT